MNFKRSLLAIGVTALALQAGSTLAAVSADDAAKLKSTLTPMGAERAGNAAGDIPEWTGGLTQAPAGGTLTDPFANEKPSLTVTAQNYKEHADALSDGQKAMFEKYPDFRMNVYPTHRTAPVPQRVADNTYNNALNATLTENGNGVVNAFGGIPFPIPQNGKEAIWNHTLRWYGAGKTTDYESFTVYNNGSRALAAATLIETYPYYDQDITAETFNGNIIQLVLEYSQPTRRKGEFILVRDPINQADQSRQAWQYIPGQRRVRRAPTIAFDTPNPGSSGLSTYDESFMYNGSPERYDWTLVGKKEMLIPYNTNKYLGALKSGVTPEELMPTHFINPDYERWEKHRVWVVEASLRDDSRHIYGKRRFYIDEDSWHVVMMDNYDGRGDLWRYAMAHPVTLPADQALVNRAFTHYDLQSGDYAVLEYDVSDYVAKGPSEDDFYTPQKVRQISRR